MYAESCIVETRDSKAQRKPIVFKIIESNKPETTLTETNKSNANYSSAEESCWICVSHSISSKRNYPRVEREGKKDYIHRYIYRRFKGDIPKGFVVRHKCDNTLCINPHHLELGTQADNMRDMTARKRRVVGKNHGNAKLTEEIAREIKYSNESGKHFVDKYGISKSVVSSIRNGKAWFHI